MPVFSFRYESNERIAVLRITRYNIILFAISSNRIFVRVVGGNYFHATFTILSTSRQRVANSFMKQYFEYSAAL
jgi:hypothetical protein